jgi:UPF0755 protein
MPKKDITMRSPYDNHLRPGPAPGLIENPGEKALAASLRPDRGDWFWCVITGLEHRITKFTDTESEFVKYREELDIHLGRR